MSPLMKKIGTWGGISWEFLEVRSSEIICIRVNVCHQRDNFLLRLHVRRALWWRDHWICRVKKESEERVIGRSSSQEHRQVLKGLIESWKWLNWYPSSPQDCRIYAKWSLKLLPNDLILIFATPICITPRQQLRDIIYPRFNASSSTIPLQYVNGLNYNNPSSYLLVLLAEHLYP
jgi:hypothetical protein